MDGTEGRERIKSNKMSTMCGMTLTAFVVLCDVQFGDAMRCEMTIGDGTKFRSNANGMGEDKKEELGCWIYKFMFFSICECIEWFKDSCFQRKL